MNPPLTRAKGKVTFNGHFETWYSQKRLPGHGLNIPGRHVTGDGLVRDGNGLTSLGTGKRYDTCNTPNTVDIYTNW